MSYSPIDKPTDYFEASTYTGGATDVSSLSFQPDWVWAKKRDGSENHGLFDSVRGATKTINSNTTDVESTRSGSLTSFDSDGWTMGGSDGIISASGSTYVGWAWRAGGGQGSSNTDGSINTTHTSVNTTSGFSISSYTGTGSAATVGHGLGVLPSMIIIKSRSKSGQNWITWHKAFTGNNEYVELNTTDAKDTYDMIDNTSNTTSVFAISGDGNVNESSATYVAYCFAEKKGYSKFGSYTGNGNADGTFVYTGFKPAFVMSKCTSHAGEDWNINDDKRPGYNVIQNALLPNASTAEVTASYQAIDTLSNGFKWRGTNDRVNASGKSYIYMAFADSPFVGSNFNPATAR